MEIKIIIIKQNALFRTRSTKKALKQQKPRKYKKTTKSNKNANFQKLENNNFSTETFEFSIKEAKIYYLNPILLQYEPET